jgi:ribosomal protein L11 methylase PrmA
MRQDVLAALALAILEDPGLKVRLFLHPAEVAGTLHLDPIQVERLASVGEDRFDAILGSMIINRLLPFTVGDHLIIAPVTFSQPLSTQRKIIRLDHAREGAWIGADGQSVTQGRVFGSGSHPTTALALLATDSLVQPGMRVLDLGTGSGVVAIAAALLGAEAVDACDIDPFAVGSAQQNVAANGLQDRISVTQDDFKSLEDRVGADTYDLLISNILGPVHEDNLDAGLADLLRPGGALVITGFKETQVVTLRRAFDAHGLALEHVSHAGPWVAMVGRRT